MSGYLFRLVLVFLAIFILRRVVRAFLISRRRTQVEHDLFKENSESPHDILGISPNASEEEIKKAYKDALKLYHPDKVAQLGDDLQQLAKKKTEDIIWAYQTLMK